MAQRFNGENGDLPTAEEMSTPEEPLKGHFCHSVLNGELHWQGVILKEFDGLVLISLFSWFDGEITNRVLIRVNDLIWNDETKTGFLLYGDRASFFHSSKEGTAYLYSAEGRRRAKVS
jgi:hypothetical protein